LTEYHDCFGFAADLYASISILDHDKKEVYKNTDENPINDKAPSQFTTPFGPDMRITGEHTGDYVQFDYGNIHWASTDTAESNKDGSCTVGGELEL
jgi:hypothetical protein